MNPTDNPNPVPSPAPTPTPNQDMMYKNPLNAMSEGEQMLFAVKRHPIGLLGLYVSFGLLLIIVGVGAVVAPNLLANYDSKMVSQIGLAIFLVAVAISAIFMFVAHVVYYGNCWILTSDSLTQMTQNSLFNKQNSQLSLGNLEDISAHQDGLLAHIFNYGLLKVETAGEHEKFSFHYCPKPNEYAQKILVARETFERGQHYDQANQSYPGGVNTNAQPAAAPQPQQ